MDALTTAASIRHAYLQYLRTLLPVRDTALADALDTAVHSDDVLVRGPLLEATPPFVAGRTLKELIAEGVFPDRLSRLDVPDGIPLGRSLHAHQEDAVRHAASGRNMVVATGTGSGKTESFMLPVLSTLAAEAEAGTLSEPGVRALLLYPMNALANDQMKRLRTMLADMPEVTFGRYIGETKHTEAEAEEAFRRQFPGETAPANELLSRERMQEHPPHLLITNYAMLEYLLLRPDDTALFDANPRSWHTVVLDEAHVYDGASGIEVGMLLRRLKDRVARHRPLRFILTSATVGGKDNGPAVAEFARELTGAEFTYDDQHHDILWAKRRPVEADDLWGPLSAAQYRSLYEADSLDDLQSTVRQLAGSSDLTPAASVLAHETNMARLRQRLAERPESVDDLAALVCDGDATMLGHMVDVGARLRFEDGVPLLAARYHHWLRATEGAFVCLDDDEPHVWLTRHETCGTCEGTCAELGACKRCNATYLTGTVRRDRDVLRLQPRRAQDGEPRWFILSDAAQIAGLVDEDDDTLEEVSGALGEFVGQWWCTRCGILHAIEPNTCRCGGTRFRHVFEAPRTGRSLKSCALCGGRSTAGQIRLFESGRDAAVAVIATELYQQLPPDQKVTVPGEGRKLLLFADSRQDAAFFAPYLESSYQQLVWRHCLLAGMHDAGELGWPVSPADVARGAAKVANANNFFPWDVENSEKVRTAATRLQAELIPVVSATSLEGLGLAAVEMKRNPAWELPRGLTQLGLDEEEGWSFVLELLRTLRDHGAMSMPDGVDPQDDLFAPRKGPIFVRGEGPNAKRKVLSWLPGKGANRRLDYARKVLAALGHEPDKAAEVLKGLWRWLTEGQIELLVQRRDKVEGPVSQLNHDLLRLRPVTTDAPVHRCMTCRRVAPYNVRDTCTTYGCDGQLAIWVPPEPDTDPSHYRRLARSLDPIPLSVREHTAQWAPEEAARIQQEFVDGKVNALSCSTTFELGVDVGDLEAVVLRNVPPRTANYVQRAGRAGRRSSSAALVVTYAQQRSHDLTYFSDPARMIAGEVQPPHVRVSNPRIAQRHAYSVALAAFLREDAGQYATPRAMGDFFLDPIDGAPAGRLDQFLESLPLEVSEAVSRVVPSALHPHIGVSDHRWAEEMRALLQLTGDRFRADIKEYEELELEASANSRYSVAKVFQNVARTVRRRPLLNTLGSHNLLPKYGFPVDSVELSTSHVPVKEASLLSLDRDLGLAISDYAPGSEVVAGGWLWKSAGVVRMPGRDLEQRHFAACRCGWYEERAGSFAVETCDACGAGGRDAPVVRKYVVPEFGFLAERTDKPKRPTRRPSRVYAGTVYVAEGLSVDDEPQLLELPGGIIEYASGERARLVVVNQGLHRAGFRICEWCGWGERAAQRPPKDHRNPRSGQVCTGPWEPTSLAHRFETDVLVLSPRGALGHVTSEVWWSTLYAILEAGATELEISRDDLDGTLQVGGGVPRLVLFDNVPGGAGHVSRVAGHLRTVIDAAHRRVADCLCGRETSCYRCLRGFRNQWRHDELRRGPVADLLEGFLGETSGRKEPAWVPAGAESLQHLEGRRVRARHRDREIEGTLWVEADGDVVQTVLIDTDTSVLEGPPMAFEVTYVTR